MDCCTPLVRYVEGNEMTTFVKQLNDSENINDNDDLLEPVLPELPELKTAIFSAAALFSGERYVKGECIVKVQ